MAPMRCASRFRRWRRKGATSSSALRASRATATSRPSCGTPRASPRSTPALPVKDFDPASATQTINRWIAGESERALAAVTEALEAYRFNEAAGAIYSFIWHKFCDWYLELIKPILSGADQQAAAETRAMTAWVLDRALKLLHPFMPFVTEELWAKLAAEGEGRETLLILAPWPKHRGLENAEADAEIGWVIRLISEVRSVRSEMNVPAGARVPLVVSGASEATTARAKRHEETILRLARIEP